MKDVFYLFAIFAVVAWVLAGISIWSHRKLWIKTTAVAATAVMLTASYVAYSELLSRPKPMDLEWRLTDLSDATVLSAKLQEKQHIYLWLQLDGIDEPRAYVLPWNHEQAKQFYGAQEEAKANGTVVRMRQASQDEFQPDSPMFYADPQPAAPLKDVPDQDTMVFDQASSAL